MKTWNWFGVLLTAFATSLPALTQITQQPPERGSFVEVRGIELYYEECGTASQTVILIHDGVVDSAVWDEVWTSLCHQFHVVRYDRPGYGRSPEASTWHAEGDDLAALLLHLKIARAVLVGSSHGAELSIDFTVARPDIVQQLVLVGPVVSGLPFSQHFLDRGKHVFELLDKGNVKDAIAEWSQDKYLIAPGNDAARKRLFDLLAANPQDTNHRDYLLSSKPALPRLHEIKVPALILVGDADIPDVHAHAGAIEAGIPNARRAVIAGVGHIMYLERPTEFSHWVTDFIQDHEQR